VATWTGVVGLEHEILSGWFLPMMLNQAHVTDASEEARYEALNQQHGEGIQ
jgi:hypothetical protein